jgi:hypothetical protein
MANVTTAAFSQNLPISIVDQPLPQTDCYGNKVEFSIKVTDIVGTATYQWQQKPPTGSFTDIPGANSPILAIDKIGVNGKNVDGTEYRVIVSDNSTTVTSNSAVLHINSLSPLLPKAGNSAICYGDNFSYSTSATGTVISYQWSINKGSGWTNISDNSNYSGATTTQLSIINATTSQNGNYRISVTFQTLNQGEGYPTCIETSDGTKNLLVRAQLTKPVISSGNIACYNTPPAPLSATAATGGSGSFNYIWQNSSDGINWFNITGASSLSYSPPGLTATTYYRLYATDSGIPSCGTVYSDVIKITVYPYPGPNPIVTN